MQIDQAIKSSAQALVAAIEAAGGRAQESEDVAHDLLVGAGPIAIFLFGDDSQKWRRRVYYLSDPNRPDPLPVFRMGQILHGRKRTMRAWISAREGARAIAASP
jgi:hypothetical protein